MRGRGGGAGPSRAGEGNRRPCGSDPAARCALCAFRGVCTFRGSHAGPAPRRVACALHTRSPVRDEL